MKFLRIAWRWFTGRCTRCGAPMETAYSGCTGAWFRCTNSACSVPP